MPDSPDVQPPAAESTSTRGPRTRIFRREALEHKAGAAHESHLLQLTPAWTDSAYHLLVAVLLVALVYLVVGTVREYAVGHAIIRSDSRIDVTAVASGTVESVEVAPGQRVSEGQVLVRLYAEQEAAELARIEREFELQLVKVLRDPTDEGARSTLTSLRAQREQALAHIEERTLRAPRGGLVSDIRARAGQQLDPGDFTMSLVDDSESFRVLGILPGQYRPLIRPTMPLRLEIQGYPYAYQTVIIEAVSDGVIGPAEARRYLPSASADIFELEEPVILVEGRLHGASFVAQGRTLQYHEGMQATAEVAVREEPLLLILVPGLRTLFEDHGDGL